MLPGDCRCRPFPPHRSPLKRIHCNEPLEGSKIENPCRAQVLIRNWAAQLVVAPDWQLGRGIRTVSRPSRPDSERASFTLAELFEANFDEALPFSRVSPGFSLRSWLAPFGCACNQPNGDALETLSTSDREPKDHPLGSGARHKTFPHEVTHPQKYAICDLLAALYKICQREKNQARRRSGLYDRPHDQFFLIEGERGTGKTTTYLTLIKRFSTSKEDIKADAKWNEEVRKRIGAAPDDSDAFQIEILRDCALRLEIQPMDFGRDERVMERVFGALMNKLHDIQVAHEQQLREHPKNGHHARSPAEESSIGVRPSVALMLKKLKAEIVGEIFPSWTYSESLAKDVLARDALDYEDYGKKHAAVAEWNARRVRLWRNWVDDFLIALERNMLFIVIDDIDLDGRPTEDLLQSMRQYLDHPRIAVVVCGKAQAMAVHLEVEQVRRAKARLERVRLRPDLTARFNLLLEDEARELFPKVISPRCTVSVNITPWQAVDQTKEIKDFVLEALDVKRIEDKLLKEWVTLLNPDNANGPLYRLCSSVRDLIAFVGAVQGMSGRTSKPSNSNLETPKERSNTKPETGSDDVLNDLFWELMTLPSLHEVASLMQGKFSREAARNGFRFDFIQAAINHRTFVKDALRTEENEDVLLADTPAGQFFVLVLSISGDIIQRQAAAAIRGSGLFAELSSWLLRKEYKSFHESFHAPRLLSGIPFWQAPANLKSVQHWIRLAKLGRFAADPQLIEAMQLVKDVLPDLDDLTVAVERGVVVQTGLMFDTKRQLDETIRPEFNECLEGNFRFIGTPGIRLPARTLVAWILWNYNQRPIGERDTIELGTDSLPQQFWNVGGVKKRQIDQTNIVGRFWRFALDYHQADLVRVLFANALKYNLWATLVVDTWRRKESPESNVRALVDAQRMEQLKELEDGPEFDETTALFMIEITSSAWKSCLDHFIDAVHVKRDKKSPTLRLPDIDDDLLRSSLKPIRALLQLEPDFLIYEDKRDVSTRGGSKKVQSESTVAYSERKEGAEISKIVAQMVSAWSIVSTKKPNRTEQLQHYAMWVRLREFHSELTELQAELERSRTRWKDLWDQSSRVKANRTGVELKVARLNPFQVWPQSLRAAPSGQTSQ
jgi:hypothetical protein